MTRRSPAGEDVAVTETSVPERAGVHHHSSPSSGLTQRRYAARSPAEVEERYVAARDAWTAAMRAANSGTAADLAALAIAQEAYEIAAAERARWNSGQRVTIEVEPEGPHPDLGAVIGQELAWRRVRSTDEKPEGLLRRLGRRLRGG